MASIIGSGPAAAPAATCPGPGCTGPSPKHQPNPPPGPIRDLHLVNAPAVAGEITIAWSNPSPPDLAHGHRPPRAAASVPEDAVQRRPHRRHHDPHPADRPRRAEPRRLLLLGLRPRHGLQFLAAGRSQPRPARPDAAVGADQRPRQRKCRPGRHPLGRGERTPGRLRDSPKRPGALPDQADPRRRDRRRGGDRDDCRRREGCPGTTYCYAVFAVDRSQNVSPAGDSKLYLVQPKRSHVVAAPPPASGTPSLLGRCRDRAHRRRHRGRRHRLWVDRDRRHHRPQRRPPADMRFAMATVPSPASRSSASTASRHVH